MSIGVVVRFFGTFGFLREVEPTGVGNAYTYIGGDVFFCMADCGPYLRRFQWENPDLVGTYVNFELVSMPAPDLRTKATNVTPWTS